MWTTPKFTTNIFVIFGRSPQSCIPAYQNSHKNIPLQLLFGTNYTVNIPPKLKSFEPKVVS